jgi:hypothetical protein
MNQSKPRLEIETEWLEQTWGEFRPWIRPLSIASITVTILLMLIVATSKSAWTLLGAGRGFIPEGYYHLWGFVLTLGTVFGQVIGWGGALVVACYLMTLVGFPGTWPTLRLAMTVVYLGLLIIPLFVYHILFGGWLLGLRRTGLNEWLKANYPDANWLIAYGHPLVDLSLIPFAVIFLAIIWKYGERLARDSRLQLTLAVSLLGTSLAVALSLAIHSILVHIRIG